jgi:hypothetical protein
VVYCKISCGRCALTASALDIDRYLLPFPLLQVNWKLTNVIVFGVLR